MACYTKVYVVKPLIKKHISSINDLWFTILAEISTLRLKFVAAVYMHVPAYRHSFLAE